MKKPFAPTSSLVYVHGTNGSGKSTLARALIAAAGGVVGMNYLMPNPKAIYTHTAAGVAFIGRYGNACGGVDGLTPYACIHDIVKNNASMDRRMFAEGLITPGLETCQQLAGYVEGRAKFVLLAPPVDQCIANVLKRRGRKGTDKPYDPSNLHRKRASAVSWANRLSQAGLEVIVIDAWGAAYLYCLDALGLPLPDINLLT